MKVQKRGQFHCENKYSCFKILLKMVPQWILHQKQVLLYSWTLSVKLKHFWQSVNIHKHFYVWNKVLYQCECSKAHLQSKVYTQKLLDISNIWAQMYSKTTWA